MQVRLFNTLQKYVLGELIVSTIGAVITINLFAFVVSALIFVRKFPVMGATFFLYSAPPLIYLVLPYTLALGLLVGVTLTFGQIANQREEVIMQFNGISYGIFTRPVVFLSMVGIVLVFLSTHFLQPKGFYAEDNRQFDVLKETLQNLPSGSNAFSFKTFSLAYDQRVEDENAKKQEFRFVGLTLLFTKDENVTQMIRAKEGQLTFSKNQYEIFFDLKDCFIVLYKTPYDKLPQTIFQKNLSINRKFVNFSAKVETKEKDDKDTTLRLTPANPTVSEQKPRIKTMNTFVVIKELAADEKTLQEKEKSIDDLENKYWAKKDALTKLRNPQENKAENEGNSEKPVEELDAEQIAQFEQELEEISSQITESKDALAKEKKVFWRNKAELYRRFGMSIAPLSFILLGFPLGLLLRQGNKLVVFSLSLLIIGVVYYPVEQYFIRLVQQDLASPIMVTIVPNLALLFVAFVLSRMLAIR